MQQQFSIPKDDPDFSDDIDLFNFGYIDSIGAVELTGFVERQFGVQFTDSDWISYPLGTIREISTFVAKRLEEERVVMPRISIPIPGVDPGSRAQLEYALTFASEDLLSYEINVENSTIEAEISSEAACDRASRKIEELVERYQKREFGLPSTVEFTHERELPAIDAWSGLLERKWVTPVGQGHVILRGMAAQLVSLIEAKVDDVFARFFGAEREFYPATILCKTLDRIHHFTSFPEHIDFVAHLKRDLDVLNGFSEGCRAHGWFAALHNDRMAENDFAICPSCCYHCYEGMENWQLEAPGRCATMSVPCHRFEGTNHRTMSRLRAFTQRDVVWIGQPRFVMESRTKRKR